MLAERLVQRGAALDVRLDLEQEPLHRGLVVARANDLERLHERDAGAQHGRELAAEDGDVAGVDLAAGPGCGGLLLDAGGGDALAAQFAAHCLFARGHGAALDFLALAVAPLPVEGHVAFDGADGSASLRHGAYSIVTLLISARLVRPALTFSSPERRRSHTPSLAAWSAMSMALPPFMMMRPMASVHSITWYRPTRPL